MSFWAYMLHCRGGALYIGHTDDLERRVAEHEHGAIPGFTADHLPVELVWSENFPTRDEAKACEQKLKGWSRAKKLALIRGDWDRISALAKKKDGPSTSSGQTGVEKESPSITVRPELVEGLHFSLQPHPTTPPLAVERMTARLNVADPNWLRLRWRIEGADRIVVPPLAGRARADGLWRATCFELFVRGEGEGYAEFNLAPSEGWAAYDFTGYREGMANRAMPRDPVCTWRPGGRIAIFDGAIPMAALPPRPWHFGLSAVIEEEAPDGERTKSYWALAHPADKPDFHDPACFAGQLAAPEAS